MHLVNVRNSSCQVNGKISVRSRACEIESENSIDWVRFVEVENAFSPLFTEPVINNPIAYLNIC